MNITIIDLDRYYCDLYIRARGRRQGVLQKTKILQNRIAPNDIGLRRAPEPDRGEGACGWSAAPQQRGTPSPTSTRLLGLQVTKYLGRSVGRVLGAVLILRLI
jgi:hypothetical protein